MHNWQNSKMTYKRSKLPVGMSCTITSPYVKRYDFSHHG